MRYISRVIWIFLLLQTTILNAQTNIQTIHVENGIIKGYYELDSNGLCYVRKGHTITIKGKTYPFYMRIENNYTIRKWVNPLDTLSRKEFINMDFALDAEKGNYKKDLFLSQFEYGYDGTIVNSAGALYYPSNRTRSIIACYYFSGDVFLYKLPHSIVNNKSSNMSFILKKMIEEKEFVILKEADTLKHLSKRDITKMNLQCTGIFSFFYCLDE